MKVLDDFTRSAYNHIVSRSMDGMTGFSLAPYLDECFSNVPSPIRGYFSPEKKYIKKIVKEFDEDIDDLVEERKCDLNDIESFLKMNVGDLFKFSGKIRQKQFSDKVNRAVEDIIYAAKIATLELYDIYEVKRNTPIIRYFWEKEIDKIFKLGLPSRRKILHYIEEKKKELKKVLEEMGIENKSDESLNRLSRRYQARIRNIKKEVRSDNFNRGIETLENKLYPDEEGLTKDQLFRKHMYYTSSNYNNIFEKVVGYIGAWIHYLFSKKEKRSKKKEKNKKESK